MRLSLLAAAALCATALGATAPLAARDSQEGAPCDTCGIPDELPKEQSQLLKSLGYKANINGMIQAVGQMIRLIEIDASAEMIMGYIIGKSLSTDEADSAQVLYDLVQRSGSCIVQAYKNGNDCSIPETNNR
ncbi:hypothetical protein H4R21_002358 [Coemansia helicoidea]|uniref:Uncharacterized protein n=1 Tax=Coemansia helicoidea TaxID=1286919 RepID=A0ACC1L7T9_9FUNG|nr:hypothetical protein H4R21_002358 [Coemansia helicoidea]